MDNPIKVAILAEALSYVKRYADKTIVIKYGGNAMINEELQKKFAEDLVMLCMVGIKPVIVHGGGPQINETLQQLGIESQFINGLRYTDADTMRVVERVLGGEINQKIVQNINRNGARSVGLTGKDDCCVVAQKMQATDAEGQAVDLGQVGEIIRIKKDLLELLINDGVIPVIAPIASDEQGETLNVNADTAAAEIAIALDAEALFLLTNTAGVLDENQNLISRLKTSQIEQLIKDDVISGGMQPKIECASHVVKNGVRSCQIIDGRLPHALLIELFTDEGAGTFVEDDMS